MSDKIILKPIQGKVYEDAGSKKPNRKVGAGGIGAAVVTIAVWATHAFSSVEIPAEVAAAASTLVGFVAAYFVREPT